jgi:hypothetical protein
MFITIERNVETPDLQTAVESFIAQLKKLSKAERKDILEDLDYMESANGNFLILVNSAQAKILEANRIITKRTEFGEYKGGK